MFSFLYISTILFIFCDLSSIVDTVGVGSPCVAGGEDGGPEDNSSRLYHIHIRTYWMCVVCACYCLQNMLRGLMYMEPRSLWSLIPHEADMHAHT